MEFEIFMERCMDILARKGEVTNYGSIQGYIGLRDIKQYSDDVITIAKGKHGEDTLFEVTVRYKTMHDGREIDIENPCIMVKNGDAFRRHGDWRHAQQHVENLLMSTV